MSTNTYFKVLIIPAVQAGAALTKTFATRTDAEQFIHDNQSQGHGEIIEVDEAGRPIAPKEVPLASAGTVGGVERYACTHCAFTTENGGTPHDCADYGRDDSSQSFESVEGMLSATPVSRVPLLPTKYFVVWEAEGNAGRWQAVQIRPELVRLLQTNHWGAEMLGGGNIGVPSVTFTADSKLLREFGFRHVRG